jgi:hypothetical protein
VIGEARDRIRRPPCISVSRATWPPVPPHHPLTLHPLHDRPTSLARCSLSILWLRRASPPRWPTAHLWRPSTPEPFTPKASHRCHRPRQLQTLTTLGDTATATGLHHRHQSSLLRTRSAPLPVGTRTWTSSRGRETRTRTPPCEETMKMRVIGLGRAGDGSRAMRRE